MKNIKCLIWFLVFGIFLPVFAEEPVVCVTCGRQLPRTSRSDSLHPALSFDGRFLVFESKKKMNRHDDDRTWDVYIYDSTSKKIELIRSQQIKRVMTQPSISGTTDAVAFTSQPKTLLNLSHPRADIYLTDHQRRDDRLITTGIDDKSHNGEAFFPSLSSNGELVLFTSNATNLVPGSTLAIRQVYLYNKTSKSILLVSKNHEGFPSNRPCMSAKMSPNGHFIVIKTAATNFFPNLPLESLTPHLYLMLRELGQWIRIDMEDKGFDENKWIVGEYTVDNWGNVLFVARPRFDEDPERPLKSKGLFFFSRSNGHVDRIIPGPYRRGIETPALSQDGQFAVFVVGNSSAQIEDRGLVVFEMSTGNFQRVVSVNCRNPAISGNGQTIAFESNDKSLVGRSEGGVFNILIVNNPFLEAKK